MPTIRRSKEWMRWAGPLSDISDATATSHALLSRWVGSDQPTRIVAALPGQLIAVADWDEFAAFIDSRDLKRLQSLKIEVGDLLGPRITMNFTAVSSALLLEVSGGDRAQVAGVFNEIIPILDRGEQLGLLGSSVAFTASVVALPVLTVAVVVATGRLQFYAATVPESGRPESAATVLFAFLLVLEAFVGIWVGRRLLPTLEVLPPGRNPAIVRFRGPVIAGIATVALSLVASVLYGLAH